MSDSVGYNYLLQPLPRQGWQCPTCQRCYSPDTCMCFYCPGKATVTTTTQPVAPEITWYPEAQWPSPTLTVTKTCSCDTAAGGYCSQCG